MTTGSHIYRQIVVFFTVLLCAASAVAQVPCPPNLGFENGNFDGWMMLSGHVDKDGVVNLTSGGGYDSFILFDKSSSSERDEFGRFPVLCPNGSGYSVRLGNPSPGAGAEQLSYTFYVPATANDFSIIYNYAVVMESPNHPDPQQPHFTVKVFDVDGGTYLDCSSFDFVAGPGLPGFFPSPVDAGVICKGWTAVKLDLFGHAGKTLRLEFTNNDCAPGGHFGYAYFDVNENCSSPVTGNNYCLNDTSIMLTAPMGFGDYTWYTGDYSTLVGRGNSVQISPPPPNDSKFALIVTPQAGLGCVDTIVTTVKVVNDVIHMTIADSLAACRLTGADITKESLRSNTSPNLSYSYHSDAAATVYLLTPDRLFEEGVYYIKGENANGCRRIEPIKVMLVDTPVLRITHPPMANYPATVDITNPSIVAGSEPGLQYSFWRDGRAASPLPAPQAISRSGTYYIRGTNSIGCAGTYPVKVLVGPPLPYTVIAPNAFTPNADGTNDRFRVAVKGEMQPMRMLVYDRWGRMVFQGRDFTRGWDGTSNGTPLLPGAYYWVMEGWDTYYNRYVFDKGMVMLVR